MQIRHGITNDSKRREAELRNHYHGFKNFRIIKRFSSKSAAQAWENGKSNAHPGGPKTSGPYYGYSHEYTRKK